MKCCGAAIVAMVRMSLRWAFGGPARLAVVTAENVEQREIIREVLVKWKAVRVVQAKDMRMRRMQRIRRKITGVLVVVKAWCNK